MAKSIFDKEEDVLLATIQRLEFDEAHLIEQKERLTTLFNQLETKAKEEVKNRKRKVDRLNSEVLDLQEKYNKLVYWVKESSTLECGQTTQLEDKDDHAEEPFEVKVSPDGDAEEPDWVDKVLPAVPENLKKTPTEDKKVIPHQAVTPKRKWLFGSR